MPKLSNPAPKAVIDKSPKPQVTNPEKYPEPTVLAPDLSEATPMARIKSDNPSVVFENDGIGALKIAPDFFSTEEGQEAALEAHDEQAAEMPDFAVGFEDFVAQLQAMGQLELAEQLMQQKTESDRWQAHEEAIEADRVETVFEVVDAGTPDDPFSATAPYFYTYLPEDIKQLVSAALLGKAAEWDDEARAEDLKGAGSPAYSAMLHWGSKQVREIAAVVASLEVGEWITPVLDAPEADVVS